MAARPWCSWIEVCSAAQANLFTDLVEYGFESPRIPAEVPNGGRGIERHVLRHADARRDVRAGKQRLCQSEARSPHENRHRNGAPSQSQSVKNSADHFPVAQRLGARQRIEPVGCGGTGSRGDRSDRQIFGVNRLPQARCPADQRHESEPADQPCQGRYIDVASFGVNQRRAQDRPANIAAFAGRNDFLFGIGESFLTSPALQRPRCRVW